MAEETLVATIRADLNQFQASMRQMVSTVQQASQQSQQHIKGIDTSFKTLTSTTASVTKAMSALGVTISAVALAQLGKDALAASTQMTSLHNSFKAITGSSTQATATLTMLREESTRIGVSFVDAAKSFQGMSAAAKGTVLEGEGVREIFLGIAEASRVAGRSQEETQRAMTAVQQMMAKGRVTAEELNQQLAEVLPGGLGAFARALKVTTADLQKLVEAGEVGLPELLKFGRQLRLEAAGGIAAAGQTFEAASTRMGNAVTRMLAALGDIVTKNPDVIRAMDAIATATEESAKRTEESRPAWDKLLSTIIQSIEAATKSLRTFRVEMDDWQKSSNLAIDKFIKGGGNAIIQWLKDYNILRKDVALPFAEGPPGMILPPQTVQGRRLMGGPTVEGPEAGSIGLFDPSKSQETALQGAKKVLGELQQIQRDIQSRKELLNNADLKLSTEQMRALNTEIEALHKRWLQIQGIKPPTDVTIFRDLPGEIKQLERFIATNAAGSTAVLQAQEKLTGLNAELAKMAMQHLPASVQEYRQLSTALAQAEQRLAATSAALKPEELQLAQAEIVRLKDEVLKLNEAWLPPEVQQYRELTRELERLKSRMSEVTDPAELRLFETHVVDLEIAVKKLARTMTEQLVDEAFANWDATLGRINSQIDTAIQKNADLIKSDYELEKALATTPEAAAKAWDTYIARLEAADVKAEDIAKLQAGRQLELVNEQKKVLEKAQRDFERFQEQVSDKVGDVLFDFTKSLTDGSTKLKDVWKDTLTTIKDLFLRTLTDMAAAALVKQILIPVGVTTGAGGTGAPGTVDLGSLLRLFGGGGTGTTTVPGATVAATDEFGAVLAPQATPTTGLTAGTAVAGVGTGIGVGTTLNAGLQQAGVGSLTAQALGGAAGGAVAGAIIGAPTFIGAPIGAVIGAVIGAAVPIIMHLLGKEPDLPNFATAIQTARSRRPGGGPFCRARRSWAPLARSGPPVAFRRGAPCRCPPSSLPRRLPPSMKPLPHISVGAR